MTSHWLTPAAGLILGLGLVAGLAACSGGDGDDPSASPSLPSSEATPSASPDPTAEASPDEGDASAEPSPTPTPEPIDPSSSLDNIVVDTAFGDPAAVTVPAPWAIDKSRNKVLSYGNGATVPSGGLVKLDYVGVNGRTGAVFDSSFVAGSPVTFNLSQVVAGFSKGLAGQRVGSRVLLAMPGSDGYDGSDMTSIGIEEGDSLVFVVDIIEAPLSAPAGEQVAAAAGLPVVGGETGKPTLSLPAGAVFPTALTVQPVVQGAGEAVTAASQVQVNYTEYAWSPDGNFRFIRQTYGNSAVAGALSGTIAAWQEGLVGVTQGSRVILVAPPDLAYPEGAAKIGVAKGDASVFVVDVLFA